MTPIQYSLVRFATVRGQEKRFSSEAYLKLIEHDPKLVKRILDAAGI